MGTAGLNVLITSAGRRVELLRSFRDAGRELDLSVRLLACDAQPELSSACQDADVFVKVPRVDDHAYVDAVIDICRTHGVSLVIPTIDPELLPLSVARHRFQAIGTRVMVSDEALVRIASDKLATASFFAHHGIPGPRTEPIEAVLAHPEKWTWPLFVKARYGSASRAAQVIATPAQLAALSPAEPLVAQSLLLGDEYTVNIFFDRNGQLQCVVPHLRIQIRAGEVEKGVTRRIDSLQQIAQKLATAMPGPRGALCFQTIVGADGAPSLIEINARFGGGYPLAHRAGAKFSRWLIEEQLGLKSSANADWKPNLMMLRWDAATYVNCDG